MRFTQYKTSFKMADKIYRYLVALTVYLVKTFIM